MRLQTLSTLILALPLAGCLENEETITIHPDGSLTVRQGVHGDAGDVSGGYNLTLDGPWRPVDVGARNWLAQLGPDTGSPEVLARSETVDYHEVFPGQKLNEVRLTAEARFDSVRDWPRFQAPAAEPYQSAYLERSAALQVEDRGDRMVYTFERTYHGRRVEGFDMVDRMEKALEGELSKAIGEFRALTAAELKALTDLARVEYRRLFENFTRRAIELSYTHGSARLGAESARAAVEAVGQAVDARFSVEYVTETWERVRTWAIAQDEGAEDAGENPLELFEQELRDLLRHTLDRSLTDSGEPEDVRTELAYGLEWSLTAYDHTADLADEKFSVRVALPGRIVAGNHDRLEDGKARWDFDFDDLKDRDRTLRVVSVLEK